MTPVPGLKFSVRHTRRLARAFGFGVA